MNELNILNNHQAYTIESIRSELSSTLSKIDFTSKILIDKKKYELEKSTKVHKNSLRHIYSTDQIVRRAKSLNETIQANNKSVYVSRDIFDDSENKKILKVVENNRVFKIDNFQIRDDLPSRTIVYSSSFNNKFTESKSTFVSLKK